MTKKNDLQERVRRWAAHEAPESVSLYIDCRNAGDQREAFSTRLKNAMRTANKRLNDTKDGSMREALSRLGPEIERLGLESTGLAVFQTPQSLEVEQLWFPVEDSVTVAQRFYLKPLLSALSLPTNYFVLALSRRGVRLLEVEADDVKLLQLDDSFTLSVEEARATLAQRQLNWHSTPNGNAVFHGQTPEERREHEDLKRFLQGVAGAVEQALSELPEERRPTARSPIVLAGVHELTAAFRRESGALSLSDDELSGDPQRTSDRQLAVAARAIASRARHTQVEALREKVRSNLHTSQVRTGVSDILHAAYDGRVEALLVREGAHIWGGYDTQTRSAQFATRADEESEDLLDRAASETYKNGGAVHELPAPEMQLRDNDEPDNVFALLRY